MTVSKIILNFHVGKYNFVKGKSILCDSLGTDIKLKCHYGDHSNIRNFNFSRIFQQYICFWLLSETLIKITYN